MALQRHTFGIYAPGYPRGLKQDFPSILMSPKIIVEAENMRLEEGAMRRTRMRLKELTETLFSTGTLTATNGNNKVQASGGPGTWGTSATHKPHWVGRTITIKDPVPIYTYTVVAIDDDGDEITLSDNYEGAGGAGLEYNIGTVDKKVPTPDGFPILWYERIEQGAAKTERLLCFTKHHAYLWWQGWTAWIEKHECAAATVVMWDTCHWGDEIIATNNLDKVLHWGGTVTDAFAVLDNAAGLELGPATFLTKARFVTSYENYLIVGGTTEGGAYFPRRIRCCDYADYEVWDAGDATYKDVEGAGDLTGFANYQKYLIISKEGSIHAARLTGERQVFEITTLSYTLGCEAPHSFVNGRDGMLYFFANDYTFRNILFQEISSDIDPWVKEIEPNLVPYMASCHFDRLGAIYWSVPWGSEATGNNRLVKYTYTPGKEHCFVENVPVSAFGVYARSAGYTIDTIPFPTIDTIDWPTIDSIESIAGFLVQLGGDTSGYTYALHASAQDDGAAYRGSFTIATDLMDKKGLPWYKRILEIRVIAERKGTGTVDISVKRDNALSWGPAVGSINLAASTQEILILPVPVAHKGIRGKTFLLKSSANNGFGIIGYEIDYVLHGRR